MDIKEVRFNVPLPMTILIFTSSINTIPILEEHDNIEQHLSAGVSYEENNLLLTNINKLQRLAINKPARIRRSTIFNDYVVYLPRVGF